jgi:alkylation response protein AidB-like acyl-CoA dehydrogenase
MDFSVATSTRELLAKARQFVANELYPLERTGKGGSFRELLPELRQKRGRARELGLWGPQIPRSYGGLELPFLEQAMVGEELGRSPYGHFVCNAQAPDAGNMEILHEFGTAEQKRRWLEPLARGEIRSCFSMTEPGQAGSNPVWMNTTAVRDGSDYVINGRKWFTSAADGAAFAVVMVITNPAAEPHHRATQLIVPTDTPGFTRVRNISCMGHAGDDWASHSEIAYEDCRVPCENLLGQEGAGFVIAQARLGPGRIHHCMRWIGVAERSFALMCDYAARRELAPGDPLGSRQTTQNWIAESRADIDAARLLVLQAAWKMDQEGTKAARVEISTIKFFTARVMLEVIDRAIQVHGALGISDDTVLSTFYRNERAARIYDGPDEVHKAVVARNILKEHGMTRRQN